MPRTVASLAHNIGGCKFEKYVLTIVAAINGHGTSLHEKMTDWYTSPPSGKTRKSLESLIESFGEDYQDLFSDYTDGVRWGFFPTTMVNGEMRRVIVLHQLKKGEERDKTVGKMWMERFGEPRNGSIYGWLMLRVGQA